MKKYLILILSFMFIGVVYAEDPNCTNAQDPESQTNCTAGNPALVDYIDGYFIGEGEEVTLHPYLVNGDDSMTIDYTIEEGESCITLSSAGKITGKKINGSCTAKVQAAIHGVDTNEAKFVYDVAVVETMQLDANGGSVDCMSNIAVTGSIHGNVYSTNDAGTLLTIRDRSEDLRINEFMVDELPENPTEELYYYCKVSKDGSYFAGWYTEESDGELVSDEEEIANVSKVYAHWSDEPIELTGVSIGSYPFMLAVPLKDLEDQTKDFEYKFNVKYTPYYATNKALVWTVEDDTILSVTNDGVIKSKKEGRTSINVTDSDNSVDVNYEVIVGSGFDAYLDPNGSVTIEVGEKLTFKYYQIGIVQVNTWPTYASSDPTIARIDERTGEVEGLKKGKVTITARLGQNLTETVELTVVGEGEGEGEVHHEAEDPEIKDKRKIKFGSGDSTGSMIDIDFSADDLTGEGVKLPESTLEKEGYILSGWKVYRITVDGEMEPILIDDEELVVPDGGTLKGFELGEGEELYLEPVWVENPKTGVMISFISILVLLAIGGGLYLYKRKNVIGRNI